MDRGSFFRRRLVAAFVIVVSCFMGATVYSQLRAGEIGVLSDSLSENAMPSITRLAAARSELRHVQALTDSYVADPGGRDKPGEILAAQKAIDVEVDEYLRLQVYPGEERIFREVRGALFDVDSAVTSVVSLIGAKGSPAAILGGVATLNAACDRAASSILDDIEFNAANGAQIGRDIESARRRSFAVALGLDALSVILTAVLALLAVRAIGDHERLLRVHNRLLSERADELEQFAGRVAHDIRNPIGIALLSLEAIHRRSSGDPALSRSSDRGRTSLLRASRLLDGLLAFARAGAQPAPDARADVRPVVGALLDELRPVGEEADIELEGELAPCSVRCDPAILEVLVSNLVRNAFRYMGDGSQRKVTVRARVVESLVRIGVEDTGIGVPSSLRSSIFEPFVRGSGEGPGVGLGLATVKRICDTHGGRAGVESSLARGSVFWFELPSATGEPAMDEAHPAASSPLVGPA